MTAGSIITVSLSGGCKILLFVPDEHPVMGRSEVLYCVLHSENELAHDWRNWRIFDFSQVGLGAVRQLESPPYGGPLSRIGAALGAMRQFPLPLRSEELAQPSAPVGTPEPSLSGIGDDLAAARSALAEKSVDLARLDVLLTPARDAEVAIRERIVRTHRQDENGLTTLDLSRRGERAPLFAALDAITAEWGTRRSERTRLHGHVKSLERLVDHLAKQKTRETAKGRKRSM